MALFTQTALGSDFDRPVGIIGDPVSPSDAISLPLSDGTVVQVFDQKRTALALLKQMRTVGKTWNVYASEDVLCVAVSYSKLLICETNLVNQKLFSSFAPIYYGGLLRFLHRSASLVLSLTDALRAVGYCVASPVPYMNNTDLRVAGVNMIVVDWNFVANPATPSQGSQLEDETPLVFDFTSS